MTCRQPRHSVANVAATSHAGRRQSGAGVIGPTPNSEAGVSGKLTALVPVSSSAEITTTSAKCPSTSTVISRPKRRTSAITSAPRMRNVKSLATELIANARESSGPAQAHHR